MFRRPHLFCTSTGRFSRKEFAKDGYRLAAEEQPIHVGYRLHFPSKQAVKVDIPQMETNQKYLVNEVFQESFDWGDAIEEDESSAS